MRKEDPVSSRKESLTTNHQRCSQSCTTNTGDIFGIFKIHYAVYRDVEWFWAFLPETSEINVRSEV